MDILAADRCYRPNLIYSVSCYALNGALTKNIWLARIEDVVMRRTRSKGDVVRRFKWVIFSLAVLVNSPAHAQSAEAFDKPNIKAMALDLFERICIQTDDHHAALAKARSLGFFYLGADMSRSFANTQMTDGAMLAKGLDGVFFTLVTGVAPNGRPEFVDEACMLGVAPGDDILSSDLEKFMGVGPAQLQSNTPVIWYKMSAGSRVRVDQPSLRGADIKNGLRPRAVVLQQIQTSFGPTVLIGQLGTRPK